MEAPTAPLFVALPDEGILQMCVMRPEPEELCPDLPLFVPFVPSELSVSLREAGLAPRVLSAADVLAGEPASTSAADSTAGSGSASAALSSDEWPEEARSLGDVLPLAPEGITILGTEDAGERALRAVQPQDVGVDDVERLRAQERQGLGYAAPRIEKLVLG